MDRIVLTCDEEQPNIGWSRVVGASGGSPFIAFDSCFATYTQDLSDTASDAFERSARDLLRLVVRRARGWSVLLRSDGKREPPNRVRSYKGVFGEGFGGRTLWQRYVRIADGEEVLLAAATLDADDFAAIDLSFDFRYSRIVILDSAQDIEETAADVVANSSGRIPLSDLVCAMRDLPAIVVTGSREPRISVTVVGPALVEQEMRRLLPPSIV